MALSGTIADWSFADILQVISTQRKSGTLTLVNDQEVINLTLHAGRIVGAEHQESGRRRLGFLRFLVDTGRVAPAGARKIAEFAKDSKRDPLEMVTEAGLLNGDRLETCFNAYVQELVYVVLQWEDGGYEFITHEVTPKHPDVALVCEGLLIEGMRRMDEWVRIAHVVQPYTVFRQVAGAEIPEDLPKRERALLRMVDSVQDTQALVRLTPLTEFEIGDALLNLHQRKLIEVAVDGPSDMQIVELGVEDLADESAWSRLVRVFTLLFLIVASVAFGSLTNGTDWTETTRPAERNRDQQVTRFALELYKLEFGAYPQALNALGDAGMDIGNAGRLLVYRPQEGGSSYSLVEGVAPSVWHQRLFRRGP